MTLCIAIYLLCEREMLMIASSRIQARLPSQETKQQNKLVLVLKMLPMLNWWHSNFLLKCEWRDGWGCRRITGTDSVFPKSLQFGLEILHPA